MIKIKDITKIAFVKNLTKAYTEGIYADTPANRKLGRVGMSYKEWSQKQQQGDKGQEKQQQEPEEKKKNLDISSINYEGHFSSEEKEKIQGIIFKTCKGSICNLDGSDKPISDKQLLEVLNDDDVVINISKEKDGEVSIEVGGLSLNRAAQARDLEFSGANWLNEEISKNIDKELKKESKKSNNNSKNFSEKNTIFDKNSDFSDINAINSLQKSLKSIIGGRMFDLVTQAKCLSIKDGKIICNSDENLGRKIEDLGRETEYYKNLSDNAMSKFDDKANVVGSLLNFLNGKSIEDNVLNNLTFKEFESAREKVELLYRNDAKIKLKNTLIDKNPKFLEQIGLTNWDWVLKNKFTTTTSKDGGFSELRLFGQRYSFDKNSDDNEAINFVKKNIEKMGGKLQEYQIFDGSEGKKILDFDITMPAKSLDLPSYPKYESKKIGEILNSSKEQVSEKQNPFKI